MSKHTIQHSQKKIYGGGGAKVEKLVLIPSINIFNASPMLEVCI